MEKFYRRIISNSDSARIGKLVAFYVDGRPNEEVLFLENVRVNVYADCPVFVLAVHILSKSTARNVFKLFVAELFELGIDFF